MNAVEALDEPFLPGQILIAVVRNLRPYERVVVLVSQPLRILGPALAPDRREG